MISFEKVKYELKSQINFIYHKCMKYILIFLVLFLTTSCTEQSVPEKLYFELNDENIELLSINYISESKIRKYVLDRIKTKHSKEYYPIISDREKVEALIDTHTKEVKLLASKLNDKTNFKLTQKVQYTKLDSNNANLVLKNFLLGNSMPISTNKLTDDGMPANFLLLIPNIEMMNNFKVDSKKFQKLISNRKNKNNKSLFMELIFNLVKFQNMDNFQTVIKEVKVYDSEAKNILLATKTETNTNQELIADWLLADGYTNKLIGIHAFSFFGYRLQDLMRTVNSIKDICDKTQKLGKHQVVVCNRHHGENILIVTTYIGGIMAKIDLLAQSTLSERDIKLIKQKIKMNLNQTASILSKKHYRWTQFGVDFDYYSDALKGLKSKMSQYNYEFGTNDKYKDLNLTLIVSMISQETKKLIKENR